MKSDDANEHFKIQQDETAGESGDDYLDADAYSSLRARRSKGFSGGGLRSRGLMIALVVVVLALLVFLFWSIPKPRRAAEDPAMMEIKTQLQQMEQRLSTMEEALADLQNLKSQLAASNELGARVDRFEASFSMRLGDLDQKVSDLEKKISQVAVQKKQPAPAKKTAAKPRKKTPPKHKIRYHTVAAGDTLYSISRKYGVSLATLKKINGLKGNAIQKGQKLRVTP